jgi:hypothetical protein
LATTDGLRNAWWHRSVTSFRHQARKGSAAALVVTRDSGRSFRPVQSRVVTATGIVANVSKFAAKVMAGLIGIGRAIKRGKAAENRVAQSATIKRGTGC